jgi:hypothetical protein
MSVERRHVLIRAYEDWFLSPVDISLIVIALTYLYQKAWLLGLFLLLFAGNLGLVGQALNKEKSFKQLAHERLRLSMTEFIARFRERLEPKDSVTLSKAVIGTWALLALAVALIAIHHTIRTYVAISLGIGLGFLMPTFFVLGLTVVGALLSSDNPREPSQDAVELIAYCRQNGRVSPMPQKWNELYNMLPDKRRVGAGWEPQLPLILGTTPAEAKVERLVEHIQWADTHGCLNQVSRFLHSLDGQDWHHLADGLGTIASQPARENLAPELLNPLEKLAKEHGFASYEQIEALDLRFDFEATIVEWGIVHHALLVAVGAIAGTSPPIEIVRSFVRALGEAIQEWRGISAANAERPIELNATGLTWRYVHSNLMLVSVHPQLDQNWKAVVGAFAGRLGEKLVEWKVLTFAELAEVRQSCEEFRSPPKANPARNKASEG